MVVRPIPGSAVTGLGPSHSAACSAGTQVVSPGAEASAAIAASMRLPASPALQSMPYRPLSLSITIWTTSYGDLSK